MAKRLSEMTLEELWQLFPIYLTEHRAVWTEWYEEEAARLREILPVGACVHHVGSTAVEEIWAKPIIDILVEVPEEAPMASVGALLAEHGWTRMAADERRMSFNRGYTEQGFAERVFHLHLRYAGDHDELYFRDYLRAHPEAAKDYERLKLSLWKRFEHDRDGYTAAKGSWWRSTRRRPGGFTGTGMRRA